MKRVTIDQLDLKDHVRWAQDQAVHDPSFIAEAIAIAPHPEITGISAIYSSKVEELFELQKRNQHWASFAPPDNFHLFHRWLFSYKLFPGGEEGGEEEEEKEEQEQTKKLLELVKNLQNFTSHGKHLFEKDKNLMLNLLESIQWVNDLLAHIHARKLQYQKG